MVQKCFRSSNCLFWTVWYNLIFDTLKAESDCKPGIYAGCSRFIYGNDMCYFFISATFVSFIMLRIADFEMNS